MQLKALIFLVDNYQTAEILASVLEMLSFCVERHLYHMKTYIIKTDLLRRILALMKSKHKFLALSEYGTAVISLFQALCVLCGRCTSTNVHLNSEFLFICCVLPATIK